MKLRVVLNHVQGLAMPILPKERAKAQALYLKAIYDMAQALYQQKTDDSIPLPIDPQGRVILDVTLNDEAWTTIYSIENPGYPTDSLDLSEYKQAFKKKLGHPIQETTAVSLDIQSKVNEELQSSLLSSLKDYLSDEIIDSYDEIIDSYKGLAKGRIISLQQETHFHAHLIGRMVRTAVEKGESKSKREARIKFGPTDENIQKALDAALLDLNKQVIELQAQALENAYAEANTNGVVDADQFKRVLNKELDKARKILLPDIAKTVRIKLIEKTGIQFDENITKHLSKHLAETTSASAHDYVHIDKGTGSINFIGASEHTSHHQALGAANVADRIMYSHHLQDDGRVVPLSHRQQVRVPSIAVKKLHAKTKELLEQDKKSATPFLDMDSRLNGLDPENKLSTEERDQITGEYNDFLKKHSNLTPTDSSIKATFNKMIVADTVDKITYLQDKYELGGDTRSTNEDLPNAFVYNLYTTLNKAGITGTIDERSNKQTQSAEHILESAHQYNRENPFNPLCLVQNMAVNGWGHELSINDGNPAIVNEAALMTQMASLHTIYETLDQASKTTIKDSLFQAYDDFLATDQLSFYSYLKAEQPTALKPTVLTKLQELQGIMIIDSPPETSEIEGVEEHRVAFTAKATWALASLYKEGAYGHHNNGFTYQALSVFTEKSSIGGCKSANERAQAVNGRVAILDFVSLDKITRDSLINDYVAQPEAARIVALADDLETGINAGNTVQITKHMNGLYESLNLEGFQAVISFIDQGGHAKLGTNKGRMSGTNDSETIENDVENASKWQCHKGLSDNVLKEFCGIENVNTEKEGLNAAINIFVGAIGGMGVGAAAFGIAAALGLGVAFPPIGIAIGIGIALVASVAIVYTIANVLPKLWRSRDAATKTRFNELQADNEEIINEANDSLQASAVVNPMHKVGDNRQAPNWRDTPLGTNYMQTGTGVPLNRASFSDFVSERGTIEDEITDVVHNTTSNRHHRSF